MNLQAFKDSLKDEVPPADLSLALQSMWQDVQPNWDVAHKLAQDDISRDGSWAHAYLHRVEGDLSNAAGWYARADRPVCTDPLETEWAAIVSELLTR